MKKRMVQIRNFYVPVFGCTLFAKNQHGCTSTGYLSKVTVLAVLVFTTNTL